MKKRKSNFAASLAKLAADEDKFFKSEVMCPVVKGQPLRVKLSGIVMILRVSGQKGEDFEGWGVFRPTSTEKARLVREASMAERREYLKLFPQVRLIATAREENGRWLGLLANAGDSRFKIGGLVPILLAQEIQAFQTVQARFDGKNFWFEDDDGGNLRIAAYLRESLAGEVESDKLSIPGLTAEARQAYAIAYLREIENKKDKNEERLKAAVERAGAEYRSYVERGDMFTVEYMVDGQPHKSVVKKDTLEVQSAGICLSGYDANFDLQSLVSVIREGANRGRIVHVQPRADGGYYGYRMRAANDTPDAPQDDDYDDYD